MKMRWLILIGVVITLAFAPLTVQSTTAQTNPLWSVEYYNNTNVRGVAAYSAQVDSVGFNWTAGAPVPGVSPDFFSARWTSVQNLEAGTYQLEVQADDGVRVFVNNAPLIDEWHTATNTTYTETFDLPAGQHVFQVDYYEGGGVAYLDYDMIRISADPTQPLATVLAGRLNVRDAPSVVTGNVITQVTRNDTLTVVGRTADSSWWQVIATNGVTGWVSGRWVDVINAGTVPVTEGETPQPTGYALTAAVNLNIRSGPGVNYRVVGWLPYQQTAQIIGRNADNSWWQINYGDVTGWVSGYYSQPEAGLDVTEIPITEGNVPTNYTLTATANLNIRSGPGIVYDVVGWLPYQQTAQVIGRNADSSWWQINYGNVTGWVSGVYTALEPSADLTVIPITG